MRIFSNFDTQIRTKCFEEHAAKFGRENVLCFWRSKLYFFIKIFSPLVFLIAICVWIVWLFYYIFEGDYLLFFSIATFILSLFFLIPIIGKWIDYKLDFIIVTPDFLIMYDQGGIFSKKVITVNEQSIKTISIERKWFLYSIFNNWDIIFLAEGDVTDHWDVKLKWIPKPEKRRDQIAKIMKKRI